MGYYMRYIISDKRSVAISTLEEALRRLDEKFSFVNIENEGGDLLYDGQLYGHLEVTGSRSELFSIEIEELREEVEESRGPQKKRVLKTLRDPRTVVAIQLLFGDREAEETLSKIGPLWEWLHKNREGVLQANGEGYYDRNGLILKIE